MEISFYGADPDPTLSANLADSDKDGLSTLLEYAFGTAPTTGNASPWTIKKRTAVSPASLKFTLAQGYRSDLTYQIEASPTLAETSWTSVAEHDTFGWQGSLAVSEMVAVDGSIILESPAPASPSQLYYRLRVTTRHSPIKTPASPVVSCRISPF